MPRLLDLADACRKSELRVIEVHGWRTRGSSNFRFAADGDIIVHHTATSAKAAGDYPSLRIVRDGRPGLSGPLSQLGLGRDGTVYVIAAGRANHAGKTDRRLSSNPYSLGIEAEHPGTGPWNPVQYQAYVRLIAALCRHYGKTTEQVRGHKEIAVPRGRKVDPTFDMGSFRTAVAREISGGGPPNVGLSVKQAQAILKTLGADPGVLDGLWGPNTSRALKTVTGTSALDAAVASKLRNSDLKLKTDHSRVGMALEPGQGLNPGQYLSHRAAPDDRFVLQGDGHLVQYLGEKAVWWSGTRFERLVLQGDGNLVGYLNGVAMWATDTKTMKFFGIQPDGHVVGRDSVNNPVWSTGKHR